MAEGTPAPERAEQAAGRPGTGPSGRDQNHITAGGGRSSPAGPASSTRGTAGRWGSLGKGEQGSVPHDCSSGCQQLRTPRGVAEDTQARQKPAGSWPACRERPGGAGESSEDVRVGAQSTPFLKSTATDGKGRRAARTWGTAVESVGGA